MHISQVCMFVSERSECSREYNCRALVRAEFLRFTIAMTTYLFEFVISSACIYFLDDAAAAALYSILYIAACLNPHFFVSLMLSK